MTPTYTLPQPAEHWTAEYSAEQMQAAYAAGLLAAPEGYKLAPIEPDLAMVIAGENYIGRHAYAKMLAAVPESTQ